MAVKIPSSNFQPNEHKDEMKQLLRSGASIEELMKRFGVSMRTLYRYRDEIKAEDEGRPPEPKTDKSAQGGQKPAKATQDLASITTKATAPIIFRMGEQSIDLRPSDLYDAFRYCEDIKRIDPSIDDDFSVMVKTACKHVWEIFSEREAVRSGARIEVSEEAG